MHTAYINAVRYWTKRGEVHENKVEIQLEPRPEEDVKDETATGLQVFSRRSGNEITGMAVLNPDQLAQLYEAIGKRLVELNHPAAPTVTETDQA